MSVDLSLLRKPFDDGQIGKLPRGTCRLCRDSRDGHCGEHKKKKCEVCGNWMTTAHIHLDYVGHAQVTDRLLDVDPEWTWEPCGWTAEGTPAVRWEQGGRAVLWIRLTVGGVSRLGVGIVGGNKPECEKELIGDALRNAAMRFGVALDLWAKGDLHGEDNEAPSPSQQGPDWPALGWRDQDDYDRSYTEVAEEARGLPQAQQDELKVWLRDQGWPKPWNRDQVEAWMVKVDDLTPDPGYDDQPPEGEGE